MSIELLVEEPRARMHETPIVFIHGMWHSAQCWKAHFLPYFAAAGYRCFAPSLRGHGASEGRDRLNHARMADYVTDLEEVIARLERAPILVGHSMGGMVVQKYLESHEAPAAVLLATVPAAGLLGAILRFVSHHPLVFLKGNLSRRLYHLIGTPDLARELLFSRDTPLETVRKHAVLLGDESYRAFLDMTFLDLPRVRRNETPLLVLAAQRDGAITPAEIAATARAYGVRAEMVDIAHDMMVEPGWQVVADRILAWLEDRGL